MQWISSIGQGVILSLSVLVLVGVGFLVWKRALLGVQEHAMDVQSDVIEAYAKKFGGPERATQIIQHVTDVAAVDGITFHMERALRANTLLAHRLLWFAEQTGGQHEVTERLLRAYFEDGLDIADPDVLADCAADAGLDRSTVRAFLDTTDGLAEVREFIAHAQDNGITAVPTFVFSDTAQSTAWMVPGAQDTDVFVRVLRRLAARVAEDGRPEVGSDG